MAKSSLLDVLQYHYGMKPSTVERVAQPARRELIGILARYDEAVKVRPALAEAYAAANLGEGSYEKPDEMRADLDEDLAEIADALVALLRKEV